MIIPLQFGFSQFISFGEEDLWNFSQSEHIIGPGSHIEYPTGKKNSNFVEDHPRNIPAKFGSNRPNGFGEEAWNVKSLQTTDDGRQVMAIVHLDLWSRWTKNDVTLLKEPQCQELYRTQRYDYTRNVAVKGLMSLSTIFQLYRSSSCFIDWGNRSTWRKPQTCNKSLTNLIT